MGRNRIARHGPLRIAYEVSGPRLRRAPWLVLIQGLGFDRTGWAPVIPALRRRFRLVLIDNRGTGRSTGPSGQFSVADLARDVTAVLDSSRIARARAHVLGVSLGGMVAQRSLVENALSPDTLVEQPGLADQIVRNQQGRLTDPAAWRALARAGAASRIPDSQLTVFPRRGHLFFWEDPAKFASAVSAFLLRRMPAQIPAAARAVILLSGSRPQSCPARQTRRR